MAQVAPRRFFYGWIVLLVGFIGYMLIIGFLAYFWPMIFPLMIADLGWTRGDASFPISIGAWVILPLYPLLGWAVSRFGARTTITIGGLGVAVLFLAFSQITALWQWFVLRGFVYPVIVVLCGALPFFTLANVWFNLRRGLAVGVMVVGGGLGGFVAPPLVTAIMEAAGSWRMGWASGAVLFAVGAIAVGIFVRSKPSDVGTYPDGLTPEEAQRAREAALARRASGYRAIARTYRSPINWALRDAVRTRPVWLMALAWGGFFFGYGLLMAHSVLHLTRSLGYSSMEAAFSISLMTGVSAPFRFFMGWLTDRIEARFVNAVGLAFSALGIALIWALPPANPAVLAAYAVSFGAGLGLVYPGLTAMIGNYYGGPSYPTIFASVVAPAGGLISGFGALTGGYIFDNTGSYGLAFAIAIALAVIPLVGILLATPPRPKEVTAPQTIS